MSLNPERDHEAIDQILMDGDDLVPSSGFLASTMERVHEEAAAPKPIPFPWLRAMPGMVMAAAVFCWCGFEMLRGFFTAERGVSTAHTHLFGAASLQLQTAGWVAMALGISVLSWFLSQRLAGRSGLL